MSDEVVPYTSLAEAAGPAVELGELGWNLRLQVVSVETEAALTAELTSVSTAELAASLRRLTELTIDALAQELGAAMGRPAASGPAASGPAASGPAASGGGRLAAEGFASFDPDEPEGDDA